MKIIKKLNILTLSAALLLPPAHSNELHLGVIQYIKNSSYDEQLKIKAEYLTYSLSRIFNEAWDKNQKLFEAISNDINISLSCYMYKTEELGIDGDLQLVDEVQLLMTNTNESKRRYQAFMAKDMASEHKRSSETICKALQ